MKILRLNCGCGINKIKGHINIDIDEKYNPDIVASVFCLPFDDESIDEINSEWFIDKLDVNELAEFAKESFRVLKPGGKFNSICPSFELMINLFLENFFEGPKNYNLNSRDLDLKWLEETIFSGTWSIGDPSKQGIFYDKLLKIFNKFIAFSARYSINNIPIILFSCSKPIFLDMKNMAFDNSIDLSAYNEILIENKSVNFNDRFLHYPIALVFKHFYPDKKIKLICNNEIEKKLFSVANGIDGVEDKVVDIPHNTFLLSDIFDIDIKWMPWQYGIKDSPEIWEEMNSNGLFASILVDNIVDYKDRFELIDKKCKDFEIIDSAIAIFIDSNNSNIYLPRKIGKWGFDNYLELARLMPSKKFIAFNNTNDIPYPNFELENVLELGQLDIIEQLYISKYCNLLISVNSYISSMVWTMTKCKIIVLDSIGTNGDPVFNGIPDKCIFPPIRYRHLFQRKDDISFIKPNKSDYSEQWSYNNYWTGLVENRNMLPVLYIDVSTVVSVINLILNEADAYESGLQSGLICKSCSLLNNYKSCLYHGYIEMAESGN